MARTSISNSFWGPEINFTRAIALFGKRILFIYSSEMTKDCGGLGVSFTGLRRRLCSCLVRGCDGSESFKSQMTAMGDEV
jgi:hypothetical protein